MTKPQLKKIKPPLGYLTWIQYAITDMDTKQLHIESIIQDEYWGRQIDRDEFHQAAADEYTNLVDKANTVKRQRDEFSKALEEIDAVKWDFTAPEVTKNRIGQIVQRALENK